MAIGKLNLMFFHFKFEEYITAALASVKYQDFISLKGENSGVGRGGASEFKLVRDHN